MHQAAGNSQLSGTVKVCFSLPIANQSPLVRGDSCLINSTIPVSHELTPFCFMFKPKFLHFGLYFIAKCCVCKGVFFVYHSILLQSLTRAQCHSFYNFQRPSTMPHCKYPCHAFPLISISHDCSQKCGVDQ